MKTKSLSSFVSVLALVATLFTAAAPKSADAMILVAGDNGFMADSFGIVDDGSTIFMCVLFLPICLLNNHSSKVSSLTKQDLMDNGVSAKVANHYFEQADALAKNAYTKKMRLQVGKGDTVETLAQDIRTINPAASTKFVNFYVKQVLAQ